MTEARKLANEIEETITQGPEPNTMAKWLCRLAKIVAEHAEYLDLDGPPQYDDD